MKRMIIALTILFLLFCGQSQAIRVEGANGYQIKEVALLTTGAVDLSAAKSSGLWQKVNILHLPQGHNEVWLRAKVEISESRLNGLYVSTKSSWALWWDDQLLFQNGRVADNANDEIPGDIDNYLMLSPQQTSNGEHWIYFHLSRYSSTESAAYYVDFILNQHSEMANQRVMNSVIPFISFGGLLLVAFYYLFLFYLQPDKRIFLLFSFLCIAIAGLITIETWRLIIPYPYTLHMVRINLVALFSLVSAQLLLWVLLIQYKIRNKLRYWLTHLLVVIACYLMIPSYDTNSYLTLVTVLILSWSIVFKARLSHDLADKVLLVCLSFILLIAFITPFRFIETWFFVAFDLIVLSLLLRLGLSMQRLREQKELAKLKAEQLNVAFLKQHIQPHFLMNTLTSLSEWVEEDPSVATEMINAIADEYRSLTTMVDKSKVTLAQEIQLCDAHLKIMSLRRDCGFELKVTGNTDEKILMIPPGILHTLIENAFSHQVYYQDNYRFELDLFVDKSEFSIQLLAPHGKQRKPAALGLGTGEQYITARMQAEFADKWQLTETDLEKGWLTEIKVSDENLNR